MHSVQLIIRESQRSPRTYDMDHEDVIIGRSSKCQLKIIDSRISREHCKIHKENDSYIITDLGSRNGFRVNGIPEKERVLRNNDRITIGFTTINFLEKDHDNEILFTSDEPNETFSFTMDLPEQEDEETALTNRELQNIYQLLNNLISVINQDLSIDLLAEKAFHEIIDLTPADEAAILMIDKNEYTILKEFFSSKEFNLKIQKKVIKEIFKTKLATLVSEKDSDRSKLFVPLFDIKEIYGILVLDCRVPNLENSQFTQNLISTAAKLLSPSFSKLIELEELTNALENNLKSEIQLDLIGNSAAMKEVYSLIRKIAPADITALITGESGTGKEIVSKAIHQMSSRKSGPLVTINCGAIPVNLIESELFGHEKGSFTGAIQKKIGCFEQANDGILFMDEVGELELSVQVKLLRAIETKMIRRVGGTKDIPVDIRIVAATNRDLDTMVRDGSFREDLYFRLQVIEIHLPALHEREGDVKLLAEYYLEKISRDMGRGSYTFSEEALQTLNAYHWPGNVRELKNSIERALVLSSDNIIEADIFNYLSPMTPNVAKETPLGIETELRLITLKELEKEHILNILDHVEGNKKQASDLLGIERKTLYNKLEAYNKAKK